MVILAWPKLGLGEDQLCLGARCPRLHQRQTDERATEDSWYNFTFYVK